MKAWIDRETYESMDPEGVNALSMKFENATGLMGVHFHTQEQLEQFARECFEAGEEYTDLSGPSFDEFITTLKEQGKL